MQFQKSTISGCRRLNFNGARSITICPTRKVQLILGTNGSGKSSLIKVLFSVLPSSKHYFFSGGYTENYIAHNGHFYYLKSTYDKKCEYVFNRDDEELNKGGTETVQLELIKQHLGLDTDIVALITGAEKLTKMSPARRKEWFTKLSHSDFSYAFSQYNKHKKNLKTTSELIKYQEQKKVEELSKKSSVAEIKAHLSQKDKLEEQALSLIEQKKEEYTKESLAELTERYNDQTQMFNEAFNRYLTNLDNFELSTHITEEWVDQLKSVVDQEQGKLSVLSDQCLASEQKHQQYLKQKDKYTQITQIEEKILLAKAAKAKVHSSIKSLEYGLTQAHLTLSSSDKTNVEFFYEKAMLLRSAEKYNLSKEELEKYKQEKQTLLEKLKRAQDVIIRAQARKEHIEETAALACPKCNHVFKPGVEEKELARINEILEQCTTFIKNNEERHVELDHAIISYGRYLEELVELNNYRAKIQTIDGYFKLIDHFGGIGDTLAVTKATSLFLQDCTKMSNYLQISETLEQLEALEKEYQEHQSSTNKIQETYLTHQQLYEQQYRHYQALQKDFTLAKQKLIKKHQILSQLPQLDEQYAALEKTHNDIVKATRREKIDQLLQWVQTQLAFVNKTLSENALVDNYVAKLDKEILELKAKEQALKLIVNTLCPSEGIIGSQMVRSINAIIDQMNEHINKVWGYGLYLEYCNIDVTEEGLDYKLPIYTKHKENGAKDVSLGSDSQMDIINFVFVLVAYRALGLENYPLFIDELDRTFDEIHRTNLTHFIRELVDDDVFSQIFIISHFQEGHGGFTDAQTVVLDESHIRISRSFNTHVTFEYEV